MAFLVLLLGLIPAAAGAAGQPVAHGSGSAHIHRAPSGAARLSRPRALPRMSRADASPQAAGATLALGDEAETDEYNLSFRVKSRSPLTLAFARQKDGSGYLLELAPNRTSLLRVDGARRSALASVAKGALAAKPVALTVKRRAGVLMVERDRRLILRAYDDRYSAGACGFQGTPAAGAVEGFRVQPVGEIEYGDDFLPDSATARDWQAVAGKWGIGSYRDPMMGEDQGPVGASWYAADGGGACLAVGGYDWWSDLAAEVTARVARGNTAGILFNYRDPRNYGLFRVTAGHPGSAAIEEVVDGARHTVARASWTGGLSWWRRLRVETHGSFARVLVDGAPLASGALTAQTDGRVGLFAEGGTEAQFDDLSIRSFSLLHDDLRPADLRAWRRERGTWSAAAAGLSARPASPALALAPGGAWSDGSASLALKVPPGGEAGLAFRIAADGTGYLLTCRQPAHGAGGWLLQRVEKWKRATLASAPAAPGKEWRRLALRAAGGRLQAFGDGSPLPLAYDFAVGSGRVGLFAEGAAPASFSSLDAAGSCPERTVPLFDTDFSQTTLRGLNQDEYLRVLGNYLRPFASGWQHDPRQGVLTSRAPAWLWYHEAWQGDMVIRCTLANEHGSGPAGLILCGSFGRRKGGYRLAVGPGSTPTVTLYREEKEVAGTSLRAPVPAGGLPVELRRDGAFVVCRVGEQSFAYQDPQPLTDGSVGLFADAPRATFDDLSISLARAVGTRFDRVDPDWQPASGQWLLHSGMTCVPWTYWIAVDARQEPALMWNRFRLPSDFEVTFRVAEHSIGNEEKEHQHFPYHDIRLTLCGTPADPNKGYTLLIGAEGGRITRLLRDGQVVAESRALPIVMGSHCNTPRQIHVRVSKQAGLLDVVLNDQRIFHYTDPSPLGGGQTALGLTGCQANFRDFIACENQTWTRPAAEW